MKINVQLTICIFDEHFFYLAVYVLYVGHRQSKDQLNSNRKEEEKKAKLNKHVNWHKPNRRCSTSFDEINEQSAFDIAKRVAIACAVNPIPS